MKYISIGVVMAPSTEHILKVSHYGTEFTLTGDLARLWLDGRYGFANSETPIEHKALSQLKRMRLVITTNPYKVGEYRALTQCIIVPTEKKGPDFRLNAKEKNILVWLREAGLRLTMAELIYLRERKISPTLDLLVILGIFIAMLRLLFLSCKTVEPTEPILALPEATEPPVPKEHDVQTMGYWVIQNRITQILYRQFPKSRWVWENPRARQDILQGERVFIPLNQAGGYRRGEVLIRNLQVMDIVFDEIAEPSQPVGTQQTENKKA